MKNLFYCNDFLYITKLCNGHDRPLQSQNKELTGKVYTKVKSN